MNSGEGDLESGLTDGRHDSKAIEHLAAAAAAHAVRVGDVAILINFSGPPRGPTPSDRPPNEPLNGHV